MIKPGDHSTEYIRKYFNIKPGNPGQNQTIRENRGNIYETPVPKELEGKLREIDGIYRGYNKTDNTMTIGEGDETVRVMPLVDTVYSISILSKDGMNPINVDDSLYIIAIADEDDDFYGAVTIIRRDEKIRFDQIKSLFGRANAIRRLYSHYRDEPGKIEYIFGQAEGIRYERYEASEDHIFDEKADQMLKYALTKETYSPEAQRAYEAFFRDPLAVRHKTDLKLQYLSRITPRYVGRKKTDAAQVRKLLDDRFYKMDKVKQQIIDVLVSNERAGRRGFNLLLVGSPGVGKTSIMEAIADAVNLPSEIIPLNGLTCPQELEGLDSGYDAADAGRIIKAFAGNSTSEMVIGFDEIDKMNRNSKEGDPMNVLYRVLIGDHEDKFLACRVSTENTIFIATANSVRNIPEPIMNRFNSVIFLDDYSEEDKLRIGIDHIIPRLKEKYGLSEDSVQFDENALKRIISDYCEDCGARDLEHDLDMIIRRMISTLDMDQRFLVEEDDVIKILDETVPDTPGILFNKTRSEYSDEVAAEIRRCLEETKVSANTMDDRFAIDKMRQKLDYLMACRNEKRSFADDFDPVRFADRLHADLFGMDKVIKEATVFYHTLSNRGHIMNSNLALCGSYGIGKTEITKSIAAAIGYCFVRISLNGISDAKELRGFSSTYSGSEPGRFIKGIKKAGSLNTVFQLDELDKLKPELASVMLDILDRRFTDNFLGVEVDLQNCIFIATANEWGKVPAVLRDRFIVVQVDGYTRDEKSQIVSDYVIPRLEKSYAASGVTVSIEPEAKSYLLETYCPSFGIRDAEKAMQQIVGGKLVEQYGHENSNCVMIDRDDVRRLMGDEPVPGGNFPQNCDQAGITKALAVSGTNRGSTFAIETVLLDGEESLEITGLPKESAIDSVKVATTCIKKMDASLLAGKQIHVHFGEGAVPKDGPSAGVALFMSIYSAATGKKIMDMKPYDIAFTGEISLTGGIFAVGGVMEKIQAACDSGCSKVFIPQQNYERLEREKMGTIGCNIIPVSDIRQVIQAV
ncbi:MAG: AAA family ATPase [Lachnospiraceae bacterium]|nr:AAA family ATPase [Lachnospiraceae bacterium]